MRVRISPALSGKLRQTALSVVCPACDTVSVLTSVCPNYLTSSLEA